MRLKLFLLPLLLAAGCATAPPTHISRPAKLFPADALITQRAVLTIHGRQLTLNGYVAKSETRGLRLVVTENFGGALADVLVKPDGKVFVMRSSPLFRPEWIEKYMATDLECIFGENGEINCPVKMLSPTHFLIERRAYKLDLQIVEIKPGAQAPELFDETRKETP
jgi:hypothetical protein